MRTPAAQRCLDAWRKGQPVTIAMKAAAIDCPLEVGEFRDGLKEQGLLDQDAEALRAIRDRLAEIDRRPARLGEARP